MIPNNIAGAISAASDGVLGLAEDIKIGDLIVSALESLDVVESLRFTRRPIQTGQNMTEMAVKETQPITLGIILANPDISLDGAASAILSGNPSSMTETWRDKKKQLYKMKNDLEVIDVQTHEELYTNCVIQSIIPLYDINENWDAFIATVTLERLDLFGDDEQSKNKLASALQNIGASF